MSRHKFQTVDINPFYDAVVTVFENFIKSENGLLLKEYYLFCGILECLTNRDTVTLLDSFTDTGYLEGEDVGVFIPEEYILDAKILLNNIKNKELYVNKKEL